MFVSGLCVESDTFALVIKVLYLTPISGVIAGTIFSHPLFGRRLDRRKADGGGHHQLKGRYLSYAYFLGKG